METKAAIKLVILFSFFGVAFSGYLTVTKLFLGTCPLTEGCPYFLGLPACVYGLVMFGALLIAGVLLWKNQRSDISDYLRIGFYVSLLGILFSGYFSITELLFPSCLIQPCIYTLLLPSCVYGLIMYVIIFLLIRSLKK